MDEYIGTVVAWAPDFAPQGWFLCQGQQLPIVGYQALYSLIGNRYGGDGRTTFALPNLCGRVVLGAGPSTGGGTYQIGQSGGTESVALTANQIPAHIHPIPARNTLGNTGTPGTNACLAKAADADEQDIPIYATSPANTTIAPTGANTGNQAHTNLQPYTVLNYIICYEGPYPPRP